MSLRYIWIKGKRLYLYANYPSWQEAKKAAKFFQKKYKNNYFILPSEKFFTARKTYNLYMNKVIAL